jgi:intraflagellar transport protein 80
LNLYSNFLF